MTGTATTDAKTPDAETSGAAASDAETSDAAASDAAAAEPGVTGPPRGRGPLGGWRQLCETRPVVAGSLLTACSALSYSAANVALRQVSRPGDFGWSVWVTANKAVVAFTAAFAICAVRSLRRGGGFPPWTLVPSLLLAGVLTQFVGNLSFQYALALGGLALTVPLTFSTLIITGAVGGRVVLGEPVPRQTLAAMGVMIAAVIVLSQAASTASADRTGTAATTAMAVAAGCLAGFGYGGVGVVIRRARKAKLSVAASLVLISGTGVVGMTTAATLVNGPGVFLRTTTAEYAWMQAASLFNALAFFAVAAAYGLMPVTRVNLINVSQAALGGIAGVRFFAEPLTAYLIFGTLLTIGGLVVTTLERAADTP